MCQVDIKAHELMSEVLVVMLKVFMLYPKSSPLASVEAQNCSGHLRALHVGHTGDQEMYWQAPGELERLLPLALTLWSQGDSRDGSGLYNRLCEPALASSSGLEAWLLYTHQGKDETLPKNTQRPLQNELWKLMTSILSGPSGERGAGDQPPGWHSWPYAPCFK